MSDATPKETPTETVETDPTFDIANLRDPKMVGSSEYHAIYDVLESAEDREHAISILDEFISHAQEIKKELGS